MMDQQKKVRFSKSEKFKVEAFLPILDILISEMTKRAEAYSQIEKIFYFFTELKTIASDTLKKNSETLAHMYHKDLNYDDILNECEHLKYYRHLMKIVRLSLHCTKYNYYNLNVKIALRVFTCLMV